ncbi:MAG TPA: hypothetical protein VM689_25570 [Aliidongia sp.]|nr:hypothetical protein [Aliidongia sp.]
MKILPAGLTALALILSVGCAEAQAPQTPVAPPGKAGSNDTKTGSYWGVDSDGKRVHVRAPSGGSSRAQADANEVPITDSLNQQALQAAQPH